VTDPLDDFLAAPENVLRNEAELTKARQRKAREQAKAAQLLAAKTRNIPTLEDLLADIVRVAEDEETNPWHEFRSISRRRYELFGHYPVEFVDVQFGTFTHALEVAGLRDQVGTQLWRTRRAEASRAEHAERYLRRYVEPYVARQEDYRELHQPYLLLSMSDSHSTMSCPFVLRSFLQAIRDLRPDGVLLNGDEFDAVQISRHPQVPGWTPTLQVEMDFVRSKFALIREAHDGDLFFTGGNHDLADRLSRYLTQVAPALASLRDLRVDRLLGLDEFDVKLLQGGELLSPAGTDNAKPGFLLWDFYRIHHGTRLGQDPARQELRDAGRSGQSGHVHRASVAYGTTERDEGMSWMTTPMGARHEVGRSYIKGTNTGWQRGFGIAWLYPDHTVHQYPVVVSGDRVTVEGHIYRRGADCTDPNPMTNWLEGWQS
jgi:hypothetical protein